MNLYGKIRTFLKKIKLIDNFSVEFPINITELVEKLNSLIDEDVFTLFDFYSNGKNNFVGIVNIDGFKIKKRIVDTKVVTVVNGSFIEQNERTKINIEIIGYDRFSKIFYCFQMIFWGIILYFLLISDDSNTNQNSVYALPAMFLVFLSLIIYPYYLMRRSMKRMKYDLEKELFYLISNKS